MIYPALHDVAEQTKNASADDRLAENTHLKTILHRSQTGRRERIERHGLGNLVSRDC
jgi:hypothetical protein